MHDMVIRELDSHEISLARELTRSNPDLHSQCLVNQLSKYNEMMLDIFPDEELGKRQRLVVGAFFADKIIGTVGVERTTSTPLPERTSEEDERFHAKYTQYERTRFLTLWSNLCRTYIGAPDGSLTIHSLAVATDHRRGGLARTLVNYAIDSLDETERCSLYIEFARRKFLTRFGTSLGFKTVHKTFLISERLQFGCWGSVLMRYQGSVEKT